MYDKWSLRQRKSDKDRNWNLGENTILKLGDNLKLKLGGKLKKLGEIENWKLGDHELSCICYMYACKSWREDICYWNLEKIEIETWREIEKPEDIETLETWWSLLSLKKKNITWDIEAWTFHIFMI